MALLTGTIQLGFLYGILALGVYISFRVLNVPDLSVEGSFTFGLAVSAVFTRSGHPFLGIIAALAAGAAAGTFTGVFITKFKIHPVLGGIITMSGLYSINLFVMNGSSNITLIGVETVFRLAVSALPFDKEAVRAVTAILSCGLCFILLVLFFKTNLGLYIRAAGDNEQMVASSSINIHATKITALAISNSCVALSGGLLAQYQGFADISSGVGIMVVGLASVIIGEALFGRRNVTMGLAAAIAGSVGYRGIIAVALKLNFFPAYALKLVSSTIVLAALALPSLRSRLEIIKLRKRSGSDA